MKISFCTTCMGRAHHLKQTLPQNIRDNPSTNGVEVEFVVLNYNSHDDLHEWMTTDPEMVDGIRSGLIKYARTTEPKFFHTAHAKNMAHRLSSDDVDIVCNLDSDNFLGKGFSLFLAKVFREYPDSIINPSHKVSRFFPADERGFLGRIALSRKTFMLLGGYDESFKGWGGEDNNLVRRAKGYGLRHYRFQEMSFLKIIAHDNLLRIKNMFNLLAQPEALENLNNKMFREGLLTKAWARVSEVARPVQVNGGGFGIGQVNHGLSGELKVLSRMEIRELSMLNMVAWGMIELVRGRIYPRLASPFPADRADGPL